MCAFVFEREIPAAQVSSVLPTACHLRVAVNYIFLLHVLINEWLIMFYTVPSTQDSSTQEPRLLSPGG